jgi:amino acid transporter
MTSSVLDLKPAALRRRLGLPLLVLYGTGITIGAGIYVLIGAIAGRAGTYSAWSFVLAALVMALTVGSYAELATRYPVSAGEAAYMRAAFKSRFLSTTVGLLTFCTGVVAGAAVTLGSAGYIKQFIDLPTPLIVVAVVLLLGAVAAWGILESVVLAGLFTLVEVGRTDMDHRVRLLRGFAIWIDPRHDPAAGRRHPFGNFHWQPARLLRFCWL